MYDRQNPYLASIRERYNLCKAGSHKKTYHFVLDLGDSGLSYEVGDSIAIFPENLPALVEKTLESLKATGKELVVDKRKGDELSLETFLTTRVNISNISRKLLAEAHQQEGKEAPLDPKKYLEERELWDFLQEHPKARFSLQELCNQLMPLLPRFYSIASSPKIYPREVHLTVALLSYSTNEKERSGICTHFLCHEAELNVAKLPVYIQPHKGFTLPEDPNIPIIMVGPGTGVAPFRAFMQEREQHHSSANWLFFGECSKEGEFLYEEYWNSLSQKQKLKLATAFSRDQPHKIYVQHKMQEHAEELLKWLQEGAYLYLCGDAKRMARDVEDTLKQIVGEEYLKQLKAEKRYLKDVY